MKICYASLTETNMAKTESGVVMWAKCLDIPVFGYLSQELRDYDPDIVITALFGGTFQVPKELRRIVPRAKIVCVLDWNGIEINNTVGICSLNECFPFVDVWMAPKFTASWIRTITKMPVVEIYRPYDVSKFKYYPLEERGKAIIVTEHTKSRQTFEARIVARRILEELGQENCYKIYIKHQCLKALTGPTLENAERDTTCNYYKLLPVTTIWDVEKLDINPILAIDHFPATLLGGWHITNALFGTPSLGINCAQACVEAFPSLCSRPYDLDDMVRKGVDIIRNSEKWKQVSLQARKFAEEHWSFEACRKIWEEQVIPLCR
jgi:hypothetical protein